MRTPLSPLEFVEREREKLLSRRGRRAVMPLVHRLALLDDDDLAVEVLRVGVAHGVTLPDGRTAAEQRALLGRVLRALRPHVAATPRELVALHAFLDFLDDWTSAVN